MTTFMDFYVFFRMKPGYIIYLDYCLFHLSRYLRTVCTNHRYRWREREREGERERERCEYYNTANIKSDTYLIFTTTLFADV